MIPDDLRRKTCVVIPTKNEEASLGVVLDRVRPLGLDLLVVDGHSTDGTIRVCEQHGVSYIFDRGGGKGQAVRDALAHLGPPYEIVCFMDADGSHDPADIVKLITPIHQGQAKHVHGSRMLGGSDELHGTLYDVIKLLGSEIITLGINYRFHVTLTDCQNGFRALDLAFAKTLPLEERITTIEQELVIKTLHRGEPILEVPTHEYRRIAGQSKIKLRRVFVRYVYSWLKGLLCAPRPVRR